MKHKIIISLLILITGFKAKAEDVTVVENSPTKLVYRDSSEANRIGKKFSVSLEPLGIGPLGSFESGINGAYHFDHNNLIQLELGIGGHEVNYGYDSKSEFGGKRIGLHYKHFAGNSFYFKGGLDYRTVKFRDQEYNISGSRISAYEFEGTALSAGFVIGNQWQWENFSVGCDWIGTAVTLSSDITRETVTVANTYTTNGLHGEEDRYLKEPNFQFLRWYVGYAF